MILVTGATGFVGTHLVRGLTKAGHKVRAFARGKAAFERAAFKGVEAAYGDVSDQASLLKAMSGCDTVIHLVGIIQPGPGYTFQSIHVEGTRHVVGAAKDAGTVKHLIYQSALGTRIDAVSDYHKTKYIAETLTKGSGLNWTITRPSIIYGAGDGFIKKLTEVIKLTPVVPVIGQGNGKLQPIYIDDLVDVFVKVVGNPAYYGRTLELGGPEQLTFSEIVEVLKAALGTSKPTVHFPLALMRPVACAMEHLLPRPPVTNDQLTMLEEDNVCTMEAMDELGIKPVKFSDGLKRFI